MSSDEQYTHEIVRDCARDYGHYVIQDRALPDIRDGLKPAQRRVLWAMHKLGLTPGKASVKSARVVGDTMGLYHPHGDASIYDTLVRLTHLPYPLVRSDGNFGLPHALIEKPPAAARYTECRLSRFGAACFGNIHVASMVPNYDDTTEEPECLPVPVPLVLVNGTDGIGYSISTRVPPHNLGEVIKAALHMLDHPDCTVEDLLGYIKGPDYGTGILVAKKQELLDLYETGQGKLAFRSTYAVEEGKRYHKLVVTGLAPYVRKKKFFETAAELARKRLIGSPVTDESTLNRKTGQYRYRDTVQYRDPQIVQDRLLPLLDSTVSYNWLMLDRSSQPRRFSLLEVLQEFLDYRREIETAVLQERQQKLSRKLGVTVAKYRAATKLQAIVPILHEASSEAEAIRDIKKRLKLKHDWQAEAILETPLRALLRLKTGELKRQGQQFKAELQDVKAQLADVDSVVRQQLQKAARGAPARGTRLRGKQKDFGAAQQYWVGVTPDGKVDISLDLPLKSRAAWNYCSFFRTDGEIAIVHDTNVVSVVHVSYLDRYTPQGEVVGAVGAKNCLVATRQGRYVAFRTRQKRAQFQAIKDLAEDNIAVVLGYADETEKFGLHSTEAGMQYVPQSAIKITRPNVKSRSLPQTVEHVWCADGVLVDDTGAEIGTADALEGTLHRLGEQNLVIGKNGYRKVLPLAEAWQQVVDGAAVVASWNSEESA